jgi:hypothetical protein
MQLKPFRKRTQLPALQRTPTRRLIAAAQKTKFKPRLSPIPEAPSRENSLGSSSGARKRVNVDVVELGSRKRAKFI